MERKERDRQRGKDEEMVSEEGRTRGGRNKKEKKRERERDTDR